MEPFHEKTYIRPNAYVNNKITASGQCLCCALARECNVSIANRILDSMRLATCIF